MELGALMYDMLTGLASPASLGGRRRGGGGLPRGRAARAACKAPLTSAFSSALHRREPKKTMDKIIRGKLELPPYLTPDARISSKGGFLLHLVLPRLSLPGPACVPESWVGGHTPTLLTHIITFGK